MALTIAVAQLKGGAGKTTLACQLAAAFAHKGFDVAGFDLDPQASFVNWSRRRSGRDNATPIEIIGLGRFGLSAALWGARRKADIIIIDTPPRAGEEVKDAVRRADLAVAPMQLSPLDLDASIPTARLIGGLEKTAMFVINRAPPRARVADIIRAEIKRQGLQLASAELGSRAAYSESLALGLGVIESAPSSLAAREISALAAEIAESVALSRAA